MEQTPIFLTKFALARLLKEFGKRLGLDDSFADILAQLHIEQSSIPRTWSLFIARNCACCAKSPESCEFLNPKPENCAEGATPEAVRSANAMVVERGSLVVCPSHVEYTESD